MTAPPEALLVATGSLDCKMSAAIVRGLPERIANHSTYLLRSAYHPADAHKTNYATDGKREALKPARSARIIAAIVVAMISAAITYAYLHIAQPQALGFDFTWPWRAARALLAGLNPYTTVRSSGGAFPFDGNFLYTLPGAFVAIPFAWMPADAAASAFSGVSAGLLAFGLSRDGFDRFPIFLSPPFIITALSGQWSSLVMAAALLPVISWVAVCKPTLGAAAFLYRPTWITVLVGCLLLIVSFVVLPTWVSDWIDNVRLQPGHRYYPPFRVLLAGGPLLLLAALRWRTSEGRWMFMLSIAPQVLTMYSAFPPMLVARTRREALTLAVLSSIAWLGLTFVPRGPTGHREAEPIIDGYWIVPLVYLPALIMVLMRPNEGPAPAWLQRIAARAPTWLSGRPGPAT